MNQELGLYNRHVMDGLSVCLSSPSGAFCAEAVTVPNPGVWLSGPPQCNPMSSFTHTIPLISN